MKYILMLMLSAITVGCKSQNDPKTKLFFGDSKPVCDTLKCVIFLYDATDKRNDSGFVTIDYTAKNRWASPMAIASVEGWEKRSGKNILTRTSFYFPDDKRTKWYGDIPPAGNIFLDRNKKCITPSAVRFAIEIKEYPVLSLILEQAERDSGKLMPFDTSLAPLYHSEIRDTSLYNSDGSSYYNDTIPAIADSSYFWIWAGKNKADWPKHKSQADTLPFYGVYNSDTVRDFKLNITHYDPPITYDTVPVLLMVADTAQRMRIQEVNEMPVIFITDTSKWPGMVKYGGELITRYDTTYHGYNENIYWRHGYEVREITSIEYATWGRKGMGSKQNKYYAHIAFLDANKNPFPKGITVTKFNNQ